MADPDRVAYQQSVRNNQRLQAERERKETKRARWLDDASGVGGHAVDATLGAIDKYARDPRVVEAARGIAKVTGPAGLVLDAHDAAQDYRAARARGVPAGEAFVESAGGLAGSQLGGRVGMAGGALGLGAVATVSSGPPTAPVGAIVGGTYGAYVGQKKGEEWGRRLAGDTYRSLRGQVTEALRPAWDHGYYMRPRLYP